MTEEQLRKLERLNTLKNKGGITEVEYEKEKREILGDESSIIIGADEKVIIPSSESNRKILLRIIAFFLTVSFIGFLFRNCDKKVEVKQISKVETTPLIDSVQLKKDRIKAEENLTKYFLIEEDEFDKVAFCFPKSAPKYRNVKGLYCYFAKQGEEVSNLRLVGQYYSSKWLYIQMVQFLVDGKSFLIGPRKIRRDKDSAGRWEWFDAGLNENTKPLIEAIANAKLVKIKYIGKQYESVEVVSSTDIESIKIALETYKGLGGEMLYSVFKIK